MQKTIFTGYKSPFLKFQHLQPFTPPRFNFPLSPVETVQPWPSPAVSGHPSARHFALYHFREACWQRKFAQSVKKQQKIGGLWRHIPLRICPLSTTFFTLFLPSGLNFSPLSPFIVQHPLCAWTLFIHELVNTSVNEGKRRFHRLPLCVGEAVWTAMGPVFGEDESPFVRPTCAATFHVFILTDPSLHRLFSLLVYLSSPHFNHWLCSMGMNQQTAASAASVN